MCDEEYEKFEITDHDLENEFNPNRKRFGLSKHQQIYGEPLEYVRFLNTFIFIMI